MNEQRYFMGQLNMAIAFSKGNLEMRSRVLLTKKHR